MKNKISIGNSGEFFAAGELERRGFSVAMPMANTELFDILVFNRETHKQWAIQVKTTEVKANKWPLTKKNESIVGENIVYMFVKLGQSNTPEYHIIPSKEVADQIRKTHEDWLSKPGRKGQKHQDTTIRNFSDGDNIWLDRWDLLA